MRARFVFAVLVFAGAVALPAPLLSLGEDALYGTWRLNLERSSYGTRPPFRRATFQIAAQEDGVRITYDTVGLRGGVIHMEWSGKFDGRDYTVEGVDQYVTNSYRATDDHTYENVVKVDGLQTSTTRITISPDGRTLTSVTTETDANGRLRSITTIWERQNPISSAGPRPSAR